MAIVPRTIAEEILFRRQNGTDSMLRRLVPGGVPFPRTCACAAACASRPFELNLPPLLMTSQPHDPHIEQHIRDFIARNLLYSDVGFAYPDDASFLREGIIDSLGIMEIVEFVQKTFGVKVDQHEVTPAHFDSVESLAAFVRRKQSSAGPS
jgi:acyl carrier protein